MAFLRIGEKQTTLAIGMQLAYAFVDQMENCAPTSLTRERDLCYFAADPLSTTGWCIALSYSASRVAHLRETRRRYRAVQSRHSICQRRWRPAGLRCSGASVFQV